MSPRERLFAVLAGQPTDRVPIWLLFPYHRTSYYTDVRTNPYYQDLHALSLQETITLDRRNLSVPIWTPEVMRAWETINDGGSVIRRETIKYGAVHLVGETRCGPDGSTIKKLLDTVDDLEAYLTLPVETDVGRITAALDAQLPAYRAECAEFPLSRGAMMLDLGEPIGSLYSAANLNEYPVWSLTHSEAIRRHLDAVMERYRIIYRYCLERKLADVYFLVGSELASPPLVSRATFQQWIVPYAQELIAMIHAYDCKAIQHYHGMIREILPDFLTMAPDALHTIEAPPTGNCTLHEAYEIVADRIVLIGNIQYDCFRSYTPAAMCDAVKEVLEECRGHRFILSPTAGPYEEIISETVRANYRAFIQAGLAYGDNDGR
jgi:uroporphyrinogen-III decarboxylase